jgi:hypothetical protein
MIITKRTIEEIDNKGGGYYIDNEIGKLMSLNYYHYFWILIPCIVKELKTKIKTYPASYGKKKNRITDH